MGCKLSISVVHPENLLKRLSPSTKTRRKSKTLSPIINPTTKTTSNDSYETLYIDSPQGYIKRCKFL